MDELLAFETFSNMEDAEFIAQQLRENGITVELAPPAKRLDAVFIGSDFDNKLVLRIPGADFPKAFEILNKVARQDGAEVDTEHPLLKMTTDELKEIIAKADEWGPANYSTALLILEKRGISYDADALKKLQSGRKEELSVQKTMETAILLAGYLTALLPFLISFFKHMTYFLPGTVFYFGGFFGLLLGTVISQSKTTLPDGSRILTYNDKVRRHGRLMIGLSISVWIIYLLLAFFWEPMITIRF